MMLADLGADVVKVEPPGGEGMRWVEWSFFGCQRGKRGVALDLKAPAAAPRSTRWCRWADIVHHNLRMPAARRLGVDDESVRAVNPDIVYCHTSSYGPRGPRADWPGYDQLFQASCGWEVAGAGEGNPPMWHRFGFMDHLCAMALGGRHPARAVPPRPHRRGPVRRRVAAGRRRADEQRDVPRPQREDRGHAGARPRADRHRARIPHPARRRRLGRDRGAPPTTSSPRCARSPASTTADDAADALGETYERRAARRARVPRACRASWCDSTSASRSSAPPTTTPPG